MTPFIKFLGITLFASFINHSSVYAATDVPIALEKASVDTHNVRKIERGAKSFASYCLVCHSLKYMIYDPVARRSGITADKMPAKNTKWWFKTPPPDLTLAAKVHSPDWLYTYLHSFYQDASRELGSNNLLFKNTNMPNPFGGIQGVQQLKTNKEQLLQDSGMFIRKPHYYSVLEMVSKGSMTSDEFDAMVSDLVTFLVYAAEPKKIIRERIGIWVLLFLAVFLIIVWLLKKEYWRNIK